MENKIDSPPDIPRPVLTLVRYKCGHEVEQDFTGKNDLQVAQQIDAAKQTACPGCEESARK